MRLVAKLITGIILISGMSMVIADPSYVQALPIDDSSQTVPNTTNAQDQTGTDDFGQPLMQGQSAVAAKAKPQPAAAKTNTADTANQASSAMDASAQDTLLLSRVMQMNQDFLNYQSKTTDQINQLQAANQQAKQQLQTIAGQVAMLQTKLATTNSSTSAAQNNNQSLSGFENQIGVVPFYIIIGIFALLIVIIILLLIPRKKNQAAAPAQKEDMKSDYDYLSTKEAIPAKLDLARSYIVMEDFAAAKKVLEEVVKEGDEAQQTLAKKLLKDCEPKQDDA